MATEAAMRAAMDIFTNKGKSHKLSVVDIADIIDRETRLSELTELANKVFDGWMLLGQVCHAILQTLASKALAKTKGE